MFFDAAKTGAAINNLAPPGSPEGPKQQSQSPHLSPKQFGGPGEGAEGAGVEAGSGEAAAAGALEELAPLALLA